MNGHRPGRASFEARSLRSLAPQDDGVRWVLPPAYKQISDAVELTVATQFVQCPPHALRRDRNFEVLDAETGERIDEGVYDGRQRRGDTPFASASHPQWMGRRGHFADGRIKAWQIARSRHRIVRERSTDELAVFGITEMLDKRLAVALNDAAMGLSMQNHRVDGATDVIDCRVADHVHFARYRIDFDFAHVRAVRKRGHAGVDFADSQ